MSSIESRADENSNRLNIGTSRDSTEGTVDRLNEAPQCFQCFFLDREITTGIYHNGLPLNYGQIVALLRDGQPGPTPSR